MYLARRAVSDIDIATVPWWSFGAIAAVAAWLGYLAGRQT